MSSTASFSNNAHVSHLLRCITGLPGSRADSDTSRLGIAYYCLSGLDVLSVMDEEGKVRNTDRIEWCDWIWALSVQRDQKYGFRSGTSLQSSPDTDTSLIDRYDPPHLIMTYTALLALTILRDDFSQLNREGLIEFLKSVQHSDGSFSSLPIGTISTERDLRLTFCAFAISSMLDDWTGINIDKAVEYITRCRTYEGGYGEAPGREAQGGPTYCALASLRLLKDSSSAPSYSLSTLPQHTECILPPLERKQTIRWLTQKQKGGFQGRTEKTPDACYCFWCGASLKILDGDNYVNNDENATFLFSCQYKYGGIAKEPGETPDPYHTYLSLASLSLYPPSRVWLEQHAGHNAPAWNLQNLDPLLNLTHDSAAWARKYIPKRN